MNQPFAVDVEFWQGGIFDQPAASANLDRGCQRMARVGEGLPGWLAK